MKIGWPKRTQKAKPEGGEASFPKPLAGGLKRAVRPWAVVLAGTALGGGLLLLGTRGLLEREAPPLSTTPQPAPTPIEVRPAPPPPLPVSAGEVQVKQGEGKQGEREPLAGVVHPSLPVQEPSPPVVKARDPFGLPPHAVSSENPENPVRKEGSSPLPLPPPPESLPPPPASSASGAKPSAHPKPPIHCRATFFGQRAGAVLEANGQEFALLVGESAPPIGKLVGVKPGECWIETKEGRFLLKMEAR